MKRKTDYKNENVIDLSSYLPEYIKERIPEGLSKNTLNRFLTKPNFGDFNGYIGEKDFRSELEKIPERTEFRQENQLQPVISAAVARQDHHLSFQDFLRKLQRTGVDTESFDTWGMSQQFNWVPPIDIDKLINYQNYYWDNDADSPQYVTIKNECNKVYATFEELKLSYFNRVPNSIEISDVDEIPNLTNSDVVLIRQIDQNSLILAKIESNTVVPFDSSIDLSQILVSEFVELTFSVSDVEEDNNEITVTLNGDYIDSELTGLTCSIIDTNNNLQQPFKIEDVRYNEDEDETEIIMEGEINPSLTANKITFQPRVIAEYYHYQHVCNGVNEYDGDEWYNIGQYLFLKDIEVISSETETAPNVSDIGTNTIVDNTVNFTDFLSENKRYTLEILTGSNRGTYTVTNFSTNEIQIDGRLFNDPAAEYRVLRLSTIDDLTVIPSNPQTGEAVYSTTNDTISVYDGSSFVIKMYDASTLIDTLNSEREYITNDWTEENAWIHKNQIKSFAGFSQATMPIIEYNNDIELSKTARVEHEWRYSRGPETSYRRVDDTPNLFELRPIELQNGTEIEYTSTNSFKIDEKYGNLEEHIEIGSIIVFSGFGANDGYYKVSNVNFVVPSNERAYSEIEVTTNFSSTTDYSVGGIIHPEKTSLGDTYDIDFPHWEFAGIKRINVSSIEPEQNPMLNVFYYGSEVLNSNGDLFQIMTGPTWQEFSPKNNSLTGTEVPLQSHLKDLALYEDYQEGDIRVYINGKRQYNIFDEESSTFNIYVTDIKFHSDITITPDDKVRIELGESFKEDIGKRSVKVYVGASDDYEEERFNLVDTRVIEQNKTEHTQYPYFRLYDVHGLASERSNAIFKFKENEEYPVNPQTLLRLEANRLQNEFTFEQLLFRDESEEKILCYKEINHNENIQSIWKHGTNNEVQIPQRLSTGAWDIPNSWYYNLEHENRSQITLKEAFRHFSTIIQEQDEPDFSNQPTSQSFHAITNPNYGVGGTIKEHNDNLDILATFAFQNHTSVPKLLRFARQAYSSQLREITDYFLNNVERWVNGTLDIGDELVSYVENNKRYDNIYGDATAWDGQVGIKNFVATSSVLGITLPEYPVLLDIRGKRYIRHHDGHVSSVEFETGAIIETGRSIAKDKQIVQSQSDPFPTESNFNEGDIILRVVKSVSSANLYVLSSGSWELIDLADMYSAALLKIERKLFNVAIKSEIRWYDFDDLKNNSKYMSYLQNRFVEYFSDYSIDNPLQNNIYDPNDPWTWNYAYSSISTDPKNSSLLELGLGSWQAIYDNIFNTPYPNEEPWKLQGYDIKPVWWESEYANTNNSVDRRWTLSMWQNILSGVIPTGEELPSGSISAGITGEVDMYDYVPVNIEDSDTVDGIKADELLPPVWASSNSSNPNVRALYEKGLDPIISPAEPFLFGQMGYNEWDWRTSVSYNYDLMEVAYYLDPMRFVHRTIGNSYVNVSCLQVHQSLEKVYSHNDTIFHGDVVDGEVVKIPGILQWFTHYSRYHGFDGASSEYRELWKSWNVNIAYQFDNVINTETFDIRNESIDTTNRDYSLELKKTEGLDDFWFKAIKAEAVKVPSPLLDNREISSDWITKITPLSPESSDISLYHPENYPFRRVSTTEFKTYNYDLLDAGLTLPRQKLTVSYNTFVSGTTVVGGYSPSTNYSLTFNLNGNPETITVNSDDVTTVGDVVVSINDQLPITALVTIDGGSIIFYGNITNFTDNGLLSNLLEPNGSFSDTAGTTGYVFDGFFEVPLSADRYFPTGSQFEIQNSTNYDGTYTIIRKFADINENILRLYVAEDANVISSDIDGEVIPSTARTIPWETGQEVYFNTSGRLPNSLEDDTPYYIIKVDDYTFEIAETPKLANNGTAITFNEDGFGQHKVGRLRHTFKPLGGKIDYAWKRHYADKREPSTIVGATNVSTIQAMCDVIFGYEEYLQDVGIESVNDKQKNVDEETGRARDWPLELEKYIDWIYSFRSLKGSARIEISGELNISGDYIDLGDKNSPWPTGAAVSIKEHSNVLPNELSVMMSEVSPYYVIVNTGNKIQLASTKENAKNGIPISFSTGGGTITLQSFRNYSTVPSRVINPYVKQFAINHELGLPADFTKGSNTDVVTTQRLYDKTLKDMTSQDVLFFRQDRSSIIETVEDSEKEFFGGHVFLDGLEHIIIFNNYSSDQKLIYDPFLGINTPRFFLEFVKPLDYTQRPTMSGLVLRGDMFTSSIEKAVSDIRYYYDVYGAFENEETTRQARKSVGYEGRKDYMDDLGISGKSQFIFWKGYIQSKGTKTAVDAFSNHRLLEGMTVDEFWAYRRCYFGSNKKKMYPEMKLFTDDVVRKELRLEFAPPTGGTVGFGYTPIRLSDRSRWNNQPDIASAMAPDNAYYFDSKTIELIENVENKWITPVIPDYSDVFVPLSYPVDGVEIYYTDSSGNRVRAIENTDYDLVNSKLVKFYEHTSSWTDITLAALTYNYNSEQPAKVIDKSKVAKVITDVPIWNPVLNQHDPIGYYAVDSQLSDDPARYNNDLIDNENNYWSSKEVDTVWFDDSLAYYVPYHDKNIYPSVDDRSMNWGQLAEFGDIKLYQWIETNIHPEDYDDVVQEEENNQDKPMSQRVTGTTRKCVYINNSGTWVKDKNIVVDFFMPEIDIVSTFDELLQFKIDSGLNSFPVEIHINGKFVDTYDYFSSVALTIFLYNMNIGEKEYVSVVKKVHTPTDEEIENGEYAIHIPHSKVKKYDPIKREEYYTYYYWVTERKDEKLLQDQSLTLFDAERALHTMTRPYMIVEGFRRGAVGYGVLFGITYDPNDPQLPNRYTQCIVKGLKNTVKDDNRYVLRFIKDYTLRDELNENDLSLQNKHSDWKLFRKNQPFKIDEALWKRLIESTIGYELDDQYNIVFDNPIPSVDRTTYDAFFPEFSTRIGLGEGQVLMDKDPLLSLLMEILNSPNSFIESVENMDEFLKDYNTEIPEDVVILLREIYNVFSNKEVNQIFFEVLMESMVLNKEHPDFFKTSWVSIDVESSPSNFPRNVIKPPTVFSSNFCYLNLPEGEDEGTTGQLAITMLTGVNSSYVNSGWI